MSAARRDELRALLDTDRPPVAEQDRWLDTRSAARYVGLHHDTLRKLAAGAIPSEQDGPACKRYYRRSDLDRWRESGGRFHSASAFEKTYA